MRSAVVAALLLVAAVASPAAALYSAGSPVLQLNPNNFKSKVSPDSHCSSASRSAPPF
jgi:protein disulfide-isomerase A6